MGTAPPPDEVSTRRVGGLRHKWICHLCPWHNWHVQPCPHSFSLSHVSCAKYFNAASVRERKGKVVCHPPTRSPHFQLTVPVTFDALPVSVLLLTAHLGLVGGPRCCAALRYSSAAVRKGCSMHALVVNAA